LFLLIFIDRFFDVSNGIEDVSERGCDQVDHGHELKAGSNSTQVVTWGITVNIPIPARVGRPLLSYLEVSL
jgi:hypothetical protein